MCTLETLLLYPSESDQDMYLRRMGGLFKGNLEVAKWLVTRLFSIVYSLTDRGTSHRLSSAFLAIVVFSLVFEVPARTQAHRA